jgi:hypothetical protein
MADQPEAATPQRQRSPGYPVLDLADAIAFADQLATLSKRHPVPLAQAAEAWGYTPRSSNTLKAAAALKRFGLVDDVGNGAARKLQLTAFGRQLLHYAADRGSPEWQRLVRDAAVRPKIHRDVLAAFDGTLPHDSIVEAYLLFDLQFSDDAARDFVKKLRRTLEFAGVDTGDGGSDSSAPVPGAVSGSVPRRVEVRAYGGGDAVEHAPAVGSATGAGQRQLVEKLARADLGEHDRTQVQIPYSHDRWATLHAAFPVTEREWDAMIAMLRAMKPGLVRDESSPASDPAGGLAGDRPAPGDSSTA